MRGEYEFKCSECGGPLKELEVRTREKCPFCGCQLEKGRPSDEDYERNFERIIFHDKKKSEVRR